MSQWADIAGPNRAEQYAARFAALAASGKDVHGEASLCAALAPAGSRVLDAGCGTGRVAIRLAELGYDCVGVDIDAAMLDQARATAPQLTWVRSDLATLKQLELGRFELIVAAGNVFPLLDRGTEAGVLADLAGCLEPGGLLVAGFGLDAEHLPPGCPVTPLQEYDRACRVAGLSSSRRFATWDKESWHPGAGYAVSVHRLVDSSV